MTKILACVDPSTYLASVCDHAAWAAGRTGSAVEVLHVLDPHRERAATADFTGAIGLGARDELLDRLTELESTRARLAQEQARTLLAASLQRLKAAGVDDVAGNLRHGSLVETVAEIDAGAELVVIGKRGESADFAKLHLGSNLERVARSVHRPLLVASRGYRPVNRMLIAFDGGPSAQKAVEYAARKPLLKGLACDLLTIGNDDPATLKRVEAAASTLRAAGFEVTTGVREGQPEEVIAEHVRRNGIDLLVMGAYGHSRIRNLLIGSTTTEMLRSCLVPVLLFR